MNLFNRSLRRMFSTKTEQPTPSFIARKISAIVSNRPTSDGAGVTVLRSIGQSPRYFAPFALLDHFYLAKESLSKGIGFPPHPHRGISTLTYVLPDEGNGSFKHMDHKGNEGIIGPGDVQFMSAGKGIVHSEMPANDRAINGLQLWINLPKKYKMMEPEYQEYTSEQLPVVQTDDGIHAKVIMGTALGVEAKVKTKTPVHYIHYTMRPNSVLNHPLPPHWNTFLYSFDGSAEIGMGSGKKLAKSRQTVFFEMGNGAKEALELSNNDSNPVIDQNQGVSITAGNDGYNFVLISGEPLLGQDDDKVIQHGPTIMNYEHDIDEFFDDYWQGQNGFEGAKEFSENWKP
jgi:redox-sensitive bicupin YhaK (pirin superfamily)